MFRPVHSSSLNGRVFKETKMQVLGMGSHFLQLTYLQNPSPEGRRLNAR